ncbi:MAG: hypothetical protein ABI554_13440 [Flavobacterium sp.]
MNHLNDKTREIVMNSSVEERIANTKKFSWIGYTQSVNIFKKLEVSDEYGNLLRDRADNYYSVQQYQQSLDYYKRALAGCILPL